ncbi:MAG: HesB/IscA family protein [Terracidiphilus sp.]
MIQLTESAVSALRSAIAATPAPIAGLRISVQSGGCSGNKYQMGLVQAAEQGDVVGESHGVAIFIDPASVPLISGTTIDFVDSLQGSGFSFSNPQAKSSCGCGKSFC